MWFTVRSSLFRSSSRSNCGDARNEMRRKPSSSSGTCQGPCGGIAPDGGMPHDKGVKNPSEHRRARVAELRKAVIRAHPDHGGNTKALQEALAALRAGVAPEAEVSRPVPSEEPPLWRLGHRPGPPGRTFRGAVRGVLTTVFWVYGVALPITLGLALLVARANASLLN